MDPNQWLALTPFRWMSPWNWFWLDVKMPLSGNADVAPVTSWDLAGDPQIENEVFREVASPGKQLGRLSEALCALATDLVDENKLTLTPETLAKVKKLEALTKQVEDVKSAHAPRIEAQVKDLLARLEKLDPDRHRELLATLRSGGA